MCWMWQKEEEQVQAGRRANGAAFAKYGEKLSGPINFYEKSPPYPGYSACALW